MYTHLPRQQDYSSNPAVNQMILWLLEQRLIPLPIAPYHSPLKGAYFNAAKPGYPLKPKFSGKNLSFLTQWGKPILVAYSNHKLQPPTVDLLKRWFAHPDTGIATAAGSQGVVWIDVDAKQFGSVEDCGLQVKRWLEQYSLKPTYVERTQGGGWHIALRAQELPVFQNFRFDGGVLHCGEVLKETHAVVLAPTVGRYGRYECIERSDPMRVGRVEDVGIMPVVKRSDRAMESSILSSARSSGRTQNLTARYKAVMLQSLLCQRVLELLNQLESVEEGERSDLLVVLAREVIGWENWLMRRGYGKPVPDARSFVERCGERLELDPDRVERIYHSCSFGVPITESVPAIYFYGGDAACGRKVRSALI